MYCTRSVDNNQLEDRMHYFTIEDRMHYFTMFIVVQRQSVHRSQLDRFLEYVNLLHILQRL